MKTLFIAIFLLTGTADAFAQGPKINTAERARASKLYIGCVLDSTIATAASAEPPLVIANRIAAKCEPAKERSIRVSSGGDKRLEAMIRRDADAILPPKEIVKFIEAARKDHALRKSRSR